jgi:molybdopterin converting factor small subunit
MRVTIRLFAAHREIAGRASYAADMPEGSSVDDVFARACVAHPGLARTCGSVAFALNAAHVDGAAPVADGDEVAFLPPTAGG